MNRTRQTVQWEIRAFFNQCLPKKFHSQFMPMAKEYFRQDLYLVQETKNKIFDYPDDERRQRLLREWEELSKALIRKVSYRILTSSKGK